MKRPKAQFFTPLQREFISLNFYENLYYVVNAMRSSLFMHYASIIGIR